MQVEARESPVVDNVRGSRWGLIHTWLTLRTIPQYQALMSAYNHCIQYTFYKIIKHLWNPNSSSRPISPCKSYAPARSSTDASTHALLRQSGPFACWGHGWECALWNPLLSHWGRSESLCWLWEFAHRFSSNLILTRMVPCQCKARSIAHPNTKHLPYRHRISQSQSMVARSLKYHKKSVSGWINGEVLDWRVDGPAEIAKFEHVEAV